jgi:hypothetical protein
VLSIRIRNELGPADPDPHSGCQGKGRKNEEIFMFLRLECSLLRVAGFSWRPERKSDGKKHLIKWKILGENMDRNLQEKALIRIKLNQI